MTDTTSAHVPSQAGPPLADTGDMAQVHRVFREALLNAPGYLGGAADPERVALVATYYDNVLALLHAHHDGEDELLWPLLTDRAPEQAGEIARIAGQHGDVTGALSNATNQLASWAAGPSEASTASAVDALHRLGAALLPHLDEEERFIVPLAAQHIYAPEWGQLPGHSMQHFAGDKLWLILGLVAEQMRPEQVEQMQLHLPPPVAAMWQGGGEAQFLAFVDELRAG